MTHKIIFINGPPRSGKDRAGYILRGLYSPALRTYKMSRPLKDGLREFFDLDHDVVRNVLELDKEKRVVAFNDLSWRQVQISLSEDWAKPVFGVNILGRLAVTKLRRPTMFDMTVITDAGFYHGCVPIVKYFHADNCLLIQLSRSGCTYEGDSRSYIDLSDIGVTTVELDNRYPLNATDEMPLTYGMQLQSVVNGWLGAIE